MTTLEELQKENEALKAELESQKAKLIRAEEAVLVLGAYVEWDTMTQEDSDFYYATEWR